MVQDNLALLLKLYRRPRAAMSDIMDGASLLFAALSVLVVTLLAQLPTLALLGRIDAGVDDPPPAEAARARPSVTPPVAAAHDEPDTSEAPVPSAFPPGLRVTFAVSSFTGAAALALLYVPAALLLATFFEPIGSFGVAFRRDFGSLLVCALMAWTAAHLPAALAGAAAGAGLPPEEGALAVGSLTLAGSAYFTFLMAAALRTVVGARLRSALTASVLAWGAMLLEPYLMFAASPFVLFWGWQFLSRDIGDVTFSFGARQSFKRHLEAATVNPRDAEAHYQLGLIHQQRGQDDKALERFRKAVEIDPAEVDAHYQLGRIARRQGRHPDAIAHFERVVARAPAHARHEVWREIGGTYLEFGEAAHARWALERYVEQRPHDPEGLYQLAVALRNVGEGEAARQALVRCVEAADTAPRYRRHEVRRWRKLAASELAGRS